MSLLDSIRKPADLRRLSRAELDRLAREIRDFLVTEVTKTGGHLGPNLGVVELTLALHRTFDSPTDRIVWDTGHQAYVHKIVTGRAPEFPTLRQAGGLSGYPSRAESEHDINESSHASTALSWADGLAKAYQLTGEDRRVVAVVGDGALTGGMCWEALNNIAAAKDRPVVVVVNDNTRSYAPTTGGLADHLATLRTSRGYEGFLEWGKRTVRSAPVVGDRVYGAMHGAKKGLKDFIAPQGLFEDLGLKYVGPVDGHDVEAVEQALTAARNFGGPVIVHCITEKGRGYAAAEKHELDKLHAVSPQPTPGRPRSGRTWTSIFSDELVAAGEQREDVVAITASMLEPTGLAPFATAYPDRVFDVGIAEQHAVTSAAGLSLGGLHPVVAVYATFLNRAFDQTLMDVALHGQAVTFVLDRAGITGDDGASHNGMWDLTILGLVPEMRVAAPRDGQRLRELFREAVAYEDGPTALRWPKGAAPADVEPIGTAGGMDVLHRAAGPDGEPDVLLVAVGSMAGTCLGAAALLAEQEIGVTVVDPRWVLPVDPALAPLAARHRLVVTVEDSSRSGGVGTAVRSALEDAEVDTPCRTIGIPRQFLDHGKPADVRSAVGLNPSAIVGRVLTALHKSSPASAVEPKSAPAPAAEPAMVERSAMR
ncbi:MAG TPA: 1-deoxy-D-xylulose-5-phosphate synthase [Mycobacteriales bacterium]|jgi:1-deoxy-D-xylulose-5-phosphate synthase|nr:1-deoxy-D-xylulose-5-phosphate synthase [Mycobacteriales bacterium]